MAPPGLRSTRFIRALCFIALILMLLPRTSTGCTLFAATGARVSGKGTLLAKNRDNSKRRATELKLVHREGGIPFLGLFDPEADGFVVAGINEKGLCVVNASAVTVPAVKRHVAKEDLTDRILATFPTVEALAGEEAMFADSHPAFYMAADDRSIALIEVAPGGKVSIKVTRSGVLAHTNHYVDPKLGEANERQSKGSLKRLGRINRLLGGHPGTLDFKTFVRYTEDNRGGPDSIRQVCGPSRNVCTLATWVLSLPRQGSPELYVKIEQPAEAGGMRKLTLDAPFWSQAPGKLMP